MPNFEDTPNVTPEIVPNPDSHEPEMPPSMVDVDIEEFLRQQEKVNEEEKPQEKPTLQ
ncbi:MAG: hypothetical protein QG581_351 [Patescibacteria group bacterium]|jgi:hypothetical protein|nr:hypothetical protein [Patescibacteria group bacterium]